MEVLAGAAQSTANHRPVLLIETIKTDAKTLNEWLAARNYKILLAAAKCWPPSVPLHNAQSAQSGA
jgi:hypothetical protein